MKSIVKAAALCAGLIAFQSASYANDDDKFALRHARICDPSGCYIAWRVIDSDGDGVCDADELMAGSNPYDPLSTPSLRVVAKLEGKSLLPRSLPAIDVPANPGSVKGGCDFGCSP